MGENTGPGSLLELHLREAQGSHDFIETTHGFILCGLPGVAVSITLQPYQGYIFLHVFRKIGNINSTVEKSHSTLFLPSGLTSIIFLDVPTSFEGFVNTKVLLQISLTHALFSAIILETNHRFSTGRHTRPFSVAERRSSAISRCGRSTNGLSAPAC